MNVLHLIGVTLLGAGVLVELLCCAGLLAARRALDSLHYVSPATSVAPLLIAAAVWCFHMPPQAEIKALLVAVILLLTSPIVSHATGQAIVAASGSTEAEA